MGTLAGAAAAQTVSPASDEADSPYGTGAGLEVILTNSGFGLGGYYQHALLPGTSLLIETSLGAGKDEREIGLSDIYGRHVIPGKANFFLMLPLHVGIQRRLFRNQIEENFRPYMQVSAGPTLGWEYPYFEDENENGLYDAGEETRYDHITGLPWGTGHTGVGGTIGLGAHFGRSMDVTQGVRLGYRLDYFANGIQLLEPAEHEKQRFFGSPFIVLTFGRLF